MKKLNGGTMAAVAVGVGVATWGVLTLIAPHHREAVQLEGVIAPEAVFGSSAPATTELAAAPAPTPVEALDETATVSEAAAPVAADLAPPPEEEPVAAAPKPHPKPEVTAPKPAPATAPAIKPEPKPEIAAAKPAPVAKAAPKPAPQAEPVKPAPKPARVVAATPKVEPARPAAKPAAVPTVAWWQGPANASAPQIVYVGSAAFKRAIVIMGSTAFASTASADQHIAVINQAGQRMSGQWEQSSANRSMLIFAVPTAGRYEVVIGGGLSDQQNRALGSTLRGPVRVE